METTARKKEIRTQIRQARKAMDRAQWQDKSYEICDCLRGLEVYQSADVVYGYLAKDGEVCLDALIETAWQDGKKVAVPKVLGTSMEFYELTDLDQVEIGCMEIGIYE